jgi:hypothetical protein
LINNIYKAPSAGVLIKNKKRPIALTKEAVPKKTSKEFPGAEM